MQPRSFLWRNIFQACTSRIAIYVDGEIEDRNVGEKDHLVPSEYEPDGSLALARIQLGAGYRLENSFDF